MSHNDLIHVTPFFTSDVKKSKIGGASPGIKRTTFSTGSAPVSRRSSTGNLIIPTGEVWGQFGSCLLPLCLNNGMDETSSTVPLCTTCQDFCLLCVQYNSIVESCIITD